MTPAATTPKTRPATGDAAGGHRRAVRRQPGSAAPRRVSGPVRGRAGAERAGTIPAPTRAPHRVRESDRRARPAGARHASALTGRAHAFLRNLPDHALVDRAVRGRAWIPILGVMLVGIVAMQVEMLKLGTSTGRAIERGTALQNRNELLRANVSALADDQRIERLAAGMGMVMPQPTVVGFLTARSANAARAASSIHAPQPSTFLSTLSSLQAAASGPVTGASPSSSAAPSSTTSSSPAAPTPTTAGGSSSVAAPAAAGAGAAAAGPGSSSTPSGGVAATSGG